MQRGPGRASRVLTWYADALQGTGDVPSEVAAEVSPTAPAAAPQTLFDRTTTKALRAAKPDSTIGILLISIDFFDVVIASHGPDIAQEILAQVGERISDVVRLTDSMAKCGDDGFVVLWAPDPGAPAIVEIATRVSNKFHEPVVTSTGQLHITVSVGVATAAGHQCCEVSPLTLQRQARSAVVSAQRTGRAQLAIYDHSVQKQAIASYQTERQLHAALRNEELSVNYQPIISLHSGETVGVEALARWEDEVLGSVSPTTFIPIAEECGLIGELGRRVLHAAVAQASAWNRCGLAEPVMAVNLSNRQLLDPQLIPMIDQLLTASRLDPRQLCLEISESVVMSDVAASMTILGHLKDLGLRLAIDNFGTGYSSLSYLRRLPVDTLKIDQSFVQSIYNRDDRVITKAIIDLAHTLGMTTVAEGVETRLQVEVLHALNCDMAQGFYLHSPTPADKVDFRSVNFEAPSLNESHDWSSAPEATTGQYVRQ